MLRNGFGVEERALRLALAALRPDEVLRPPDQDIAYLVGRLLATVELAAGSGGQNRDWARFDAGYRSALRPKDPQMVALKRMVRTARQLTELPGTAARGAAAGLVGATSVLFAEILFQDDGVPLSAALEQLTEARTLFTQSLDTIADLRQILGDTVPPD